MFKVYGNSKYSLKKCLKLDNIEILIPQNPRLVLENFKLFEKLFSNNFWETSKSSFINSYKYFEVNLKCFIFCLDQKMYIFALCSPESCYFMQSSRLLVHQFWPELHILDGFRSSRQKNSICHIYLTCFQYQPLVILFQKSSRKSVYSLWQFLLMRFFY